MSNVPRFLSQLTLLESCIPGTHGLWLTIVIDGLLLLFLFSFNLLSCFSLPGSHLKLHLPWVPRLSISAWLWRFLCFWYLDSEEYCLVYCWMTSVRIVGLMIRFAARILGRETQILSPLWPPYCKNSVCCIPVTSVNGNHSTEPHLTAEVSMQS